MPEVYKWEEKLEQERDEKDKGDKGGIKNDCG